MARGSDGQRGSGVYTVDDKGGSSSAKVEHMLREFRENGTTGKPEVWEYIRGDFLKITGTEVAP